MKPSVPATDEMYHHIAQALSDLAEKQAFALEKFMEQRGIKKIWEGK